MPGSDHGTNNYIESLATDGSTIVRFNNFAYPDSARVQQLRYADRDVTSIGELARATLPGWAAVGFAADGQVIQLNGVTGDLNWLEKDTYEVEKSFPLPNGRETNNRANNSFVVRENGTIIVPTLDESRGDWIEHYVLRRVDAAVDETTPTPPNESEEERFLELERIAREAATQEEAAKVTEAEEALDEAQSEGDEKAIKKAELELGIAQAAFAIAEAEFTIESARPLLETDPDNEGAKERLEQAQQSLTEATATHKQLSDELAALDNDDNGNGDEDEDSSSDKSSGSSVDAGGWAGIALAIAAIFGIGNAVFQMPAFAKQRQQIEKQLAAFFRR